MNITLDTDSDRLSRALLAYLHLEPEHLAGMVHDALCTALLSRDPPPHLREPGYVLLADRLHAAIAREGVALDGPTVVLALAERGPGDPRPHAEKRAADLASFLGVPIERVMLGAIRVGLRIILPPADQLRAGGVEPPALTGDN